MSEGPFVASEWSNRELGWHVEDTTGGGTTCVDASIHEFLSSKGLPETKALDRDIAEMLAGYLNKKAKDGTFRVGASMVWPLGRIQLCERRGALGRAARLRQKYGLPQSV